MVFALNGREYTQLIIVNYSISLEVLDGEGTGRSKAHGWGLIRDPQGVITNLKLEFAATTSQNADFKHLWAACKSMGRTEFATVSFTDPTGETITQQMYLVVSELRCRRIERNGVVYTDSIKVSFVAKQGV